jgi:hypothetical protein
MICKYKKHTSGFFTPIETAVRCKTLCPACEILSMNMHCMYNDQVFYPYPNCREVQNSTSRLSDIINEFLLCVQWWDQLTSLGNEDSSLDLTLHVDTFLYKKLFNPTSYAKCDTPTLVNLFKQSLVRQKWRPTIFFNWSSPIRFCACLTCLMCNLAC